MKRKGVFKHKEITNAGGSITWMVTGTKLSGERVRLKFPTEVEAIGERQRLEIEAKNMPAQDDVRRTWLTLDECRDAEYAVTELKGRGKSLRFVVRWFLDTYREPVNVIQLPAAFDAFLADKAKQGCREDTLRNLRGRVGMLKNKFPTHNVSDVLPDHIEEFLRRAGSSPANQNNDRRAVSSFFSWAKQKKYCTHNPVSEVDAVKHDTDEPEVLPLSEARLLVEKAAKFKGGKLLPYVVLGMFCAIRPTEFVKTKKNEKRETVITAELTWDDIDLEEKTVTISAKLAKMRGRRIVEIPDNAVKWLLPHAVRKTPLKTKNFRKDFDALKESIGYAGANRGAEGNSDEPKKELKPWVQDVLRHTGISNHLAMHQHEGKTAQWAGNSPDVIQKHYRSLVTEKQAKEFYAITPDKKKIVKLKVVRKKQRDSARLAG